MNDLGPTVFTVPDFIAPSVALILRSYCTWYEQEMGEKEWTFTVYGFEPGRVLEAYAYLLLKEQSR
jgi:hypothetical protein